MSFSLVVKLTKELKMSKKKKDENFVVIDNDEDEFEFEDEELIEISDDEPEAVLLEPLTDKEKEQRKKVVDLRKQISQTFLSFAKELTEVHTSKLYQKFGFKTWKQYVEEEVDFNVRKADYLVSISNWIKSLPDGGEQWVGSLGWTKAKELTQVVDSSNFHEWKEKVAGLSYREIKDLLNKDSKKKETIDTGGDELESNNEELHKKIFSLYRPQLKNLNEALTKAKSIAETSKDGHALDLICTSFLSDNVDSKDLSSILRKIEKIFDVVLFAANTDLNDFIYNGDIIEAMAEDDHGKSYFEEHPERDPSLVTGEELSEYEQRIDGREEYEVGENAKSMQKSSDEDSKQKKSKKKSKTKKK